MTDTSPTRPLPKGTGDKTGVVGAIRENFHQILQRHATGESLQEIAESIDGIESGVQIRRWITLDPEMSADFNAVIEIRAHWMVEEAGRLAGLAAKSGDVSGLKCSIDAYLKIASKIAPKLYGDKSTLEVVGAGGGPVKHTVEMSPEDAYKAMLSGAPKA